MRRWNGWGDDSIHSHLGPLIQALLEENLGKGVPQRDVPLAEVVAQVPSSRLPVHPLTSDDPTQRVLHARGQSFADWVALRHGRLGQVPDGVAFPTTKEQVRDLLRYAYENEVALIPYGGGTSVVGHINPSTPKKPVLTVSMARMNRVVAIDTLSAVATLEAGMPGPLIESALRAQGLTLGHYPQSFEYSTLGGWVATRSSGQQSRRYGRVDQFVLGAEIETPTGPITIRPVPASAAGPDVKQLVLGSEGRAGIITQATVRCARFPEKEVFLGVFFPTWESGMNAIRALAQSALPLSMLRLSTPQETQVNITLSGNKVLHRLFRWWNKSKHACMAIVGVSGTANEVKDARRALGGIVSSHRGFVVGTLIGRQWQKSRFRTPYLRNTLWDAGYAVDTLETATTWDKVPYMVDWIETALKESMQGAGGRVFMFTHLSHVYSEGSSIYTTYVFPLALDPDETLRQWNTVKTAVSHAILHAGGTITHQHGVGMDHKEFTRQEKGELSTSLLASAFHTVDPKGLMNPDKLLDG